MNFTYKTGLSILLIALTSSAYASFSFHANSCNDISGDWAGSGEATNWLIDCNYHGTGQIGAVDENGNFILYVNVDKDQGSFVCPSHREETLKGTCHNGNIVIDTNHGNLTGTVTHNYGEANGTISIAPGVSADVVIKLQRN